MPDFRVNLSQNKNKTPKIRLVIQLSSIEFAQHVQDPEFDPNTVKLKMYLKTKCLHSKSILNFELKLTACSKDVFMY